MTKLFATGATGYIGGDAIHAIANAHPEYEITCLVRNSDKGALVAKDYPEFTLVYGDLDSVKLLEEEAKKADIVCHFADADHLPAAKALLAGLSAHPSSQPGYLIHTSGTGLLLFADIASNTYGQASSKIYDDLSGVSQVTSVPDSAPHRPVEKVVLEAGAQLDVRTAIVSPPTIYGSGRGPGNRRSHQLPELARCTVERGKGFVVGEGKALWSNVHVHDLSDLYLKLVEAAVAGRSSDGGQGKEGVWGGEGYYFAENGTHEWGQVARRVAKEAHAGGWIASEEVKSIGPDEANQCSPWGAAMWGANSRSKATRARKVLGWAPKGASIEEEVKRSVEVEVQRLGLSPGHAKIAAGEA